MRTFEGYFFVGYDGVFIVPTLREAECCDSDNDMLYDALPTTLRQKIRVTIEDIEE